MEKCTHGSTRALSRRKITTVKEPLKNLALDAEEIPDTHGFAPARKPIGALADVIDKVFGLASALTAA